MFSGLNEGKWRKLREEEEEEEAGYSKAFKVGEVSPLASQMLPLPATTNTGAYAQRRIQNFNLVWS